MERRAPSAYVCHLQVGVVESLSGSRTAAAFLLAGPRCDHDELSCPPASPAVPYGWGTVNVPGN